MKKFLFPFGMLAIGVGVGVLVAPHLNPVVEDATEPRVVPAMTETRFSERYKFINPLLECDSYMASEAKLMTALRVKLKDLVDQLRANGNINEVSVYYRDLNNGPWIGLNEGQSFAPASMLKVPIMMAVLKKAESSPGFIDKKLIIEDQDVDDFEPNIDDKMIEVGSEHSVASLIESMIVYSDNTAKNALIRALDISVDGVDPWKAIGMAAPNASTPENFLSVKEYSSFFRILYNSTYLTRDHSEWALQLLSRTNFQDGIRAGVGSSLVVASKFGERGSVDTDAKQLHECGIVYDGGRPYLLCIMTRGTSWNEQATAIQEIAKVVHGNR